VNKEGSRVKAAAGWGAVSLAGKSFNKWISSLKRLTPHSQGNDHSLRMMTVLYVIN